GRVERRGRAELNENAPAGVRPGRGLSRERRTEARPTMTQTVSGVNGVCPRTVREAAYWYFDRGEIPTPLRPRSKIPLLAAWQILKTERADLDRLFPRGTRLCELRSSGAQTMVCPSVWVDDEDPDHTEAVE